MVTRKKLKRACSEQWETPKEECAPNYNRFAIDIAK